MKKVKIMLMSLMVLAVVGGALAFKAKSPGLFCSTTDTAGGCNIPNQQNIRFAVSPERSLPDLFCTNVKGDDVPCVTVTNE